LQTSSHLRATFVELLELRNQSFTVQRFTGPGGSSLFNYHIGYQISLIRSGIGRRTIGDNVSRFVAPDMVVVGTGLPHMWRTDTPQDNMDSLVVNFSEQFLSGALHHTPELIEIDRMLQEAKRGLLVGEDSRREVEDDFWQLQSLDGFDRLMSLLRILNRLSMAHDLEPIASVSFEAHVEKEVDSRLSQVFDFIEKHMHEPISRDQLAKVACMSPSNFSRYFKDRTGASLPAYLNDFRIGRACGKLASSTLSIAEIANQSGFGSVTGFNRVFQAAKSVTPTEYRKRMKEASELDGPLTEYESTTDE
jgi:AraC-like DNA-binding protein